MTLISYRVFDYPDDQSMSWNVLNEAPPNLGNPIDSRSRLSVKPGDLPDELYRIIRNANSDVIYVENGGRIYEVSRFSENGNNNFEEDFLELMSLKNQGNENLKNNLLQPALDTYLQGVAQLEWYDRRTERDVAQLVVPLYANIAHVYLKMCEWAKAVEFASLALELDPNNVKALFRRALARIENRDFGAAKRDLLSAQFVDPKNAEIGRKIREIEKIEKMHVFHRQQESRVVCQMDIAINGASVGSLVFKLFAGILGRTVKNFELGIESGKYEKCKFFKIVKNQFAQSGDYEFNDGSGGNCFLDKCDVEIRNRNFFNDENRDYCHSKKGLLGMANYGPNTNQSQFYVTLGAPLEHLDGKHVVFGELIEGEDVLEKINQAAENPTWEVVLDRIQIVK